MSHIGISSKLPFHFLYVQFLYITLARNAEVETKMKQCDIKVQKRHSCQKKAKKAKMIKVASLGDHELVVCQILSRLPAKSLMRFKCVCESWQSLIQRDGHFIDLHFSRSRTRSCNGTVGATSLLVRVPSLWYRNGRCLLSAKLLIPSESGNGGGAAVQMKIPLNITTRISMLNIVNGLICLMDQKSRCVSVFNPSTRESTPWIKSIVMQKQEEKGGLSKNDKLLFAGSWDAVGYDHATKDYKAVSFWTYKIDHVCEIFSLRHKSWRIIDAVPPVCPTLIHFTHFVHVTGSIYWLRAGKPIIVVVELNLVTEKFRVISVPNEIIIYSCIGGCYKTEVMEVGNTIWS
ncbi:F-box protein At2g07140-like [Papaver somniferum]|uniref:F-box protein At2g07140-like n=1 Tax=Papaver somniferum TaxID=3469 RepID=UPI000E6FFA46|nr:F-box protein At2g07140-like [Papaver somniferum]